MAMEYRFLMAPQPWMNGCVDRKAEMGLTCSVSSMGPKGVWSGLYKK